MNNNDAIFRDTYGTIVKDGTKILIEYNYNYSFLNGKEAIVQWNAQKGMYQYLTLEKNSTPHDFWGIHSFKVIQS